MKLKDGTYYKLGIESVPLGYHWPGTWLKAIEDRYGNVLTIGHPIYNSNKIGRITSPNGRWVDFTYDASNRVTQITDNIGRTVNYVYDASGRLWKVIDPAGGVTEYGYDSSHRMTSIKDAKGITYLTNEYDANGRVYRQTQADGGVYEFAYTLDAGGKTLYTDVTDPRGNVRRVYFNTDGYGSSDTYALNQPEQQVVSYTRQTGTNLITRVTDPLSRNTDYTYDGMGNPLTVTRLAGTGNAVTTTFTYEPTWNQVATVTDPLNHITTFAYDTAGNLTSVTDPLSHATMFTYDTKGRPLTVKDALNNTTTFAYDPEQGDLRTITDPLNRIVTRYTDSAGRLVRVDDPMGKSSRTEYDVLNQVTKVVDPLAGTTTFTYDLNGNLLGVTDARSNATSYTYDNMDRVITRTDPLTRAESYQYDLNSNLTQHTDRSGKVTTYTYDKLDRSTFVGFSAVVGTPPTYESTVSYTYDTGGRLTQIVDSVSGTIQHSYDNLDRLTSEITPQGTVSYTYDAADRRATMTAGNQAQTTYTYDNADRLTGITQGTQSVGFTYDNADRRASLTLPNGIVVSYGYDNASQLTGMTYTLGANTLGNLAYAYDLTGRRASMGGTWARTNLPTALASATYDAANQLTQWGTTTLTYDANGNMTNDGTNTLTWNARNQLASMSGGVTASFQYDPLGRRVNKTIGGVSVGFLHDHVNSVQEQLGAGVYANILVGGVDDIFSRTDQLGTQSFIVDALGSTLSLTNSVGTVLTQYTYEPFGTSTSSGSASTASLFTARENDGTGLFFYRARYYSPSLSRFVSQDPIGFYGGANLYAYVGNRPTSLVDPYGLKPLTDCVKNLLRPYFPDTNLDAVDIQEDVRIQGWLGNAAMTWGNKIDFAPGYYDPYTTPGISLIAHELKHVEQFQRYGKRAFLSLYLQSYLFGVVQPGVGHDEAYRKIGFERVAFDIEDKVLSDLLRKYGPKQDPCGPNGCR